MTPEHLHAAASFLANVARATGFPPNVDPKAKIATMAAMLAEKYPDTRMFCDAAASYVAFECGMMNLPSVAILARLLEKWWDRNRPASAHVMLPGREASDLAAADLAAADKALVSFWLRDCTAGTHTRAQLGISLAVMRRHAERGYWWLLNAKSDAAMQAALIAVEHRWPDDAPRQRQQLTQEEMDEITRPLDQIRPKRNASTSPVARTERPSGDARTERPSGDARTERPSGDARTERPSGDARTERPSGDARALGDALTMRTPDPQPPVPSHVIGASKVGLDVHSEQARAERTARFEARHGRKPGELAPEVLQAVRMNTPGLREIAERDAHRAEAERCLAEAMPPSEYVPEELIPEDDPETWTPPWMDAPC